MTDNDKHKLSDEELDDYLAGKDSVSKAYRELDDATSPPHLDEQILARARENVQSPGIRTSTGKSTRNDVFIRPYATAATVFVCLGISFLFLNNPDVPGTAELRSLDETASKAVQISLEEQAPAAPEAQAPEPARFAADQRQEADGNAVGNTANFADGAADNDAGARAAQAERIDLPDLVESRRLSESAETPQQTVASANQLTQQAASFSYRENREDWLEEIAQLREFGNTQQAEEEAQLFLESYPETDLEAALQDLETP